MPRSLFWRTLQVAGKDILAFALSSRVVPWLAAWFVGWFSLVMIAALSTPPDRTVGIFALRMFALPFPFIALGMIYKLLRDIGLWWSRCRARAQGAE